MLPPVTPMEIQRASLKVTGHIRGVKFHCPEVSVFPMTSLILVSK